VNVPAVPTRTIGGVEVPQPGTWKVDPSDLFDVANLPTAAFRSTRLAWEGRSGSLRGDVTIKGSTHPIGLEVEFLGAAIDPWGNPRAGFEAHGRIDRERWGINWNAALESGGVLVSKDIDLVFNVELVPE
jgi:polyisoprenoid-binding protein YceI